MRVLQILKLRGSGFLSGQHAYRLSADGFDVFPRLADEGVPGGYELDDTRISSGIAGLDDMLGEGFWPGASTLVAGPSGSGKTVMGLHFLFSGARNGELGLMATLQENPSQLERTARGFGWSLAEPNVRPHVPLIGGSLSRRVGPCPARDGRKVSAPEGS